MKTTVASLTHKASIWAVGSLAALLAVGTPAFAQHGGGGHGGGGGGGGGGHASMGGGGGHSGGFGGGHAGGFGGARAGSFGGGGYAGSRGFGGAYSGARPMGFTGGHAVVGTQYAPRSAYSGLRGGYTGSRAAASVNVYHNSGYVGRPGYAAGRAAYVGHPAYGYGYGRGGFGWHRPYWGGGYWRGGYWPRCYYGWSYPWFLGVLPGVYATYWWGGVPYYYANNVYYTWNPGYNGYVVTDPPPADGQESASSAPAADGTYDSAEPGSTSGGTVGSSGSAEVYAYPKSGQSDEQQSTDRYECHKWAVAQSGFDPTRGSQASGSSADYRRAMIACLDGRGYSTK